MANLLYILLVISTFFSFTCINATSKPIISCNQTPYPQVCNSLVNTNDKNQYPSSKPKSNFWSSTLDAALKCAQRTHKLALSVNTRSLDARAKAAWADCLELCEDTIDQLTRCSASSAWWSYEDTQTWLSSTLTNQQTCKSGFVELSPSYHFTSSPFVTTNLTEAIKNCLAVNNGIQPSRVSDQTHRRLLSDGFPKWVSVADRRLLQSSTSIKANVVVASDGTGDYKTISEALKASSKLRSGTTSRFIIKVNSGVYKENVQVTKSMKNIMMIGDGIDSTVVTGSKNVQDGSTTFKSATFAISGDGFIAQDMTFENTAGAAKHQAVALRASSDLSVFYRCSFKGYQDTLYVYSQRQFYRNCDIYGTIDFIFGDAIAVVQNSSIYVRRPMTNQKNTVTAQGRSDPNENTGISIINSVVTAGPDLKPVQGSFRTYLGRPWHEYSRTVFMESSLDGIIDPAGWLEWSGGFALDTLYYGEYLNTGAGANTSQRVSWPGYHVISDVTVAAKFTVGNFLLGDSWIPATGVPYTSGL